MFQLQTIYDYNYNKKEAKNNIKLNQQIKLSPIFYLYERPELTKFFDIDG